MKTKKIDYSKVLRTNVRRLLDGPEEFSVKIGIKLTTGKYSDKETKGSSIAEAMALWMCITPDSQFHDKMRECLRAKKNFDWKQYTDARDAQVQELSSRLASIEETSGNAWVRAVCRFMLLPKDVVRKWLWHENVDFQSCESFLRRLTDEQHMSLRTHYDLVKGGTETKKLPCFADGVLNKVWKFFGFTAKEEPNRMATKSAVAHDFLGMGMGFALYPDITDDRTVDQKLAAQFLAKKQDRGSFEVNKEHGGLYWFLYRTLRSNSLYREGKYVELGRWVCPGFWFTMIMWGILTLVSPACLIAAASLYALKGVTSWVLLGLGAIAPIVTSLVWIKKLCNKEYDDEYWRWFLVALACFLGINLAHMALLHAKDYWSVGAGILCLVFLVPYCIKKETLEFWHAPILGKLLPLMFLSAGAWDIHVHSNFWQDCVNFFWWFTQSVWSLMQSVAHYIYEVRYMITWGVVGVAFYLGLFKGLFHLSDWMVKKSDTMIEKGDIVAYYYEKTVNWGVGIAMAICIFVGGMITSVSVVSNGVSCALFGFVSLPFLVFFASRGINRVDVMVSNKVWRRALLYSALYDKDMFAIREALSSNKFWGDITHAVARADVLHAILTRSSGCRVEWVIAIIRSVRNDAGLANADKFASSVLFEQLPLRVDAGILELILSGAREDVLREVMERMSNERIADSQEERGSTIGDDLVAWLKKKAWPFLIKCFMFITWPLRMLWRMACDLYDLWEVFNEQCPQSPPRDRPVAQ